MRMALTDNRDGRLASIFSGQTDDKGRLGVRLRKGERGGAVVVVMAVLALLTVLVMADSRRLHALKQEIRLIDQEQQLRWQSHTPPPAVEPASSEPGRAGAGRP